MSRDALILFLLAVAGGALAAGGFLLSVPLGCFVLGGWAAATAVLLMFASTSPAPDIPVEQATRLRVS